MPNIIVESIYTLDRIDSAGGKLHGAVTRQLALKIIEAGQRSEQISFPPEADLSEQLGVSRTVVRESMKVLVDKGLVEMWPRQGPGPDPAQVGSCSILTS